MSEAQRYRQQAEELREAAEALKLGSKLPGLLRSLVVEDDIDELKRSIIHLADTAESEQPTISAVSLIIAKCNAVTYEVAAEIMDVLQGVENADQHMEALKVHEAEMLSKRGKAHDLNLRLRDAAARGDWSEYDRIRGEETNRAKRKHSRGSGEPGPQRGEHPAPPQHGPDPRPSQVDQSGRNRR